LVNLEQGETVSSAWDYLRNSKEGFNLPERIDDLIIGGYKIIQDTDEFCFSIDAVLLAHFPKLKKGMKIIDFGTGTGVIPLILAAREANLDKIIGLEIQSKMVDLARRSTELNNLQKRIEIIEGNINKLNELHLENNFDLVLCNPPYKPLGEGKVNPKESVAIARHEILVTLHEIISNARKVLKFGGKLVLIHQTNRLTDIIYYLRENKLEPKRIQMIHPTFKKKSNLVLIEATLGGGKEVEVMDPLFIYNEAGGYAQEILQLYSQRGKTLEH